MFDIGFFEIVIVGIIALLVLGPEKLPGTIRTLSLWIGRLRRSFNSIKQDIEREIGADEIRRQLRNEEIMEKFRNTQAQVQDSIKSIKKETDEFKKNVNLESQVTSLMKGDKAEKEKKEEEKETAAGKAQDQASAGPQAGEPSGESASQGAARPATSDTKPESGSAGNAKSGT